VVCLLKKDVGCACGLLGELLGCMRAALFLVQAVETREAALE
jgi:hypothetical protein